MDENFTPITEAIHALTQPTFFDWITFSVSTFSVIISGVAIYYAISVPKTIANHRNRITLFEKRYQFYLTLLELHGTFFALRNQTDRQKISVLIQSLERLKSTYSDDTIFHNEMMTALNSPKYFFGFDITVPQYAGFRSAVKQLLQTMRGTQTLDPEQELTGIYENLDFFYETVQNFESYFYICPPKNK